ncbi:hypothetical protein LguiB_033458 [Lonicera macranthoides]
MLFVILPFSPPFFSDGYRVTLKSPPMHHLSPHNPYRLESSSHKSFLSLYLQGP